MNDAHIAPIEIEITTVDRNDDHPGLNVLVWLRVPETPWHITVASCKDQQDASAFALELAEKTGWPVPGDVFDPDGNNLTASRLLDEHHELVPQSAFGDGTADNCLRCGFAAGWIAGADRQGHATVVPSIDVRSWIRTVDRWEGTRQPA